jgi:hypothetical protein
VLPIVWLAGRPLKSMAVLCSSNSNRQKHWIRSNRCLFDCVD